jgi:hypothetical protein
MCSDRKEEIFSSSSQETSQAVSKASSEFELKVYMLGDAMSFCWPLVMD